MTTLFQLVLVFIFTMLLACDSPSVKGLNIGKPQVIVDTPWGFVKNYGIEDSTLLFAFVGEKLSVDPLPRKRGSMDNCFKAKYLILEKVYGSFVSDTIEFVVYDHMGKPAFSEYKNVLLFVSADRGTYYHQKYLFNDVYITKNGRWAGSYASDDYEHAYNKHTKIKPEKIEFAENISFPLGPYNKQETEVQDYYPKPYYKIVRDTAFPVYGNYVEDLVTLKMQGFLTARELFKATAEQEEDMVESYQPEAPKTPPSADDVKFLSFWKDFVASLKEQGLKDFKEIALDSLYICDQVFPTAKFIEQCFTEVIDEEVKKRAADRTKLEYDFRELEFDHLLTKQSKAEILKIGNGYRLRTMEVTRSTKNNNPATIYFSFIETKRGYRLYEIGHHWFKDCCM